MEETHVMRTRLLAIAIGAGLGLTGTASAQTYGIGANPQGSIFYAAGAAMSKVMVEKTGLQFRVSPYAGSSTYIPLINRGELPFGLANTAESSFAYNGTEMFKGHPNKNLRAVMLTIPILSGIGVRKDSGMKTVSDLKGKKVPIGFNSGRIFHFLQGAALATAGLSEKDLQGIPTPNFIEGAKLFMSGRSDAAYFPLNAGISKQAMAQVPGGWRYLNFDGSEKGAKKMEEFTPTSLAEPVKPGPAATGVEDNPTYLVRVDILFMAGAHVADDVVYKVVKTAYEGKSELAKALGAFNRFDPKGMVRKHPAPYHPGAIKFYQEVGLWPK
jgi:TRAP transporter TAXI family solute receptor